jgi:hypothetical protein
MSVLLFVSAVLGTSTVSFLENQSQTDLTLCYYTTQAGDFKQTPTQFIPAGQAGNWSNTADLYHSIGWIQYDVYYNISDCMGTCILDASYLWDLAFGVCRTDFVSDCTSAAKKRSKPRKALKAVSPTLACSYSVTSSNCFHSSPIFTFACD